MNTDSRRFSPATLRNREPLARVLRDVLRSGERVLEIASGTGEHATYLAPLLKVRFLPSDASDESLASIQAWRTHLGVREWVDEPLRVDVTSPPSISQVDAILCCNMVHIAPWEACEGLFALAASALVRPGGRLVLYGPFVEDDVETAPSNVAFDASLRLRDPRWGIRRLADVDGVAKDAGLARSRQFEMPANNRVLVYEW